MDRFCFAISSGRSSGRRPPVPPRHFNPNLPPNLELIVLKVLSKEPSQRYRTADQLGRVLISFTSQKPPAREPKPTAETDQIPEADERPDLQATSAPVKPTTRPSLPSTDQPSRPVEVVPSQQISRPLLVEQDAQALPGSSPFDLDWMTVTLGLLTVLAVGGLIPLWVWVYFSYNPPVP